MAISQYSAHFTIQRKRKERKENGDFGITKNHNQLVAGEFCGSRANFPVQGFHRPLLPDQPRESPVERRRQRAGAGRGRPGGAHLLLLELLQHRVQRRVVGLRRRLLALAPGCHSGPAAAAGAGQPGRPAPGHPSLHNRKAPAMTRPVLGVPEVEGGHRYLPMFPRTTHFFVHPGEGGRGALPAKSHSIKKPSQSLPLGGGVVGHCGIQGKLTKNVWKMAGKDSGAFGTESLWRPFADWVVCQAWRGEPKRLQFLSRKMMMYVPMHNESIAVFDVKYLPLTYCLANPLSHCPLSKKEKNQPLS